MRIRLTHLAVAAVLAALVVSPALAQTATPSAPPAPLPKDKETQLGWSDKGEIAWTLTAGNADSNTISLANTLQYRWSEALFKFYAFGIRSKSQDTRYFQVYDTTTGQAIKGAYVEQDFSSLNAERYVLALDFESNISAKMYWFAATGWERNEPAGLASRIAIGGGVGNIWYENDRGYFKTSYGIGYTWESYTSNELENENYLGANVTADWLWKFSANSSFQTVDTLFLDFMEMGNWRINSNNALTVQMNKLLALKVGLTFLYDAQPAEIQYPVYGRYGSTTDDSVYVEADKLDTIFTTALVVGF